VYDPYPIQYLYIVKSFVQYLSNFFTALAVMPRHPPVVASYRSPRAPALTADTCRICTSEMPRQDGSVWLVSARCQRDRLPRRLRSGRFLCMRRRATRTPVACGNPAGRNLCGRHSGMRRVSGCEDRNPRHNRPQQPGKASRRTGQEPVGLR